MKPETNLIKETNLRTIRKIIRGKSNFTKSELANVSGLSSMTIGNLINELSANGEVVTGDTAESSMGRKAMLFSYNSSYRFILTVALFERKKQLNYVFSIQDLCGGIIEQSVQDGGSVSVYDLKKEIAERIERIPKIQAVVIGVPGVVTNERLLWIDFPQLGDANFKQTLQEGLDREIHIINDANAALYGYGFERSDGGIIAGIYYPDNYQPGAALIINGQLVTGRNGLVGEITHNLQDWQAYSPSLAKQYLLNTIQELICYYDPNEIIIFHHGLFDEYIHKEIAAMLDVKYPDIAKPQTLLIDDFDSYYIRGLCFYALDTKTIMILGEK